MVFKNILDGIVLYKQYVRYETNALYLSGITEIARRGISIQGIVCDGRKGLLGLFGDIPIQMCQFHQIQIVDIKTKNTSSGGIETTYTKINKTNKGRIC